VPDDDHTSGLGDAEDDEFEQDDVDDEPFPVEDLDHDLILEERAEEVGAETEPAVAPPPQAKSAKPTKPPKAGRARKSASSGAKRESPLARVRGKTTAGVKKATGWMKDVTKDAKRAIVEGAKSQKEVRTLQILLASVSCLAVLFLILAIIGFTSRDETEVESRSPDDRAVAEGEAPPADASPAARAPDPKVLEELEAARSTGSALRQDLARARGEADNLKSQVSELTRQRDELRRRDQERAPRDAGGSERAVKLESALRRVNKELAEARTKTEALERDRGNLVAEIEKLRDAAKRAETEADRARDRSAELETELADLKEELKAVDELLPSKPLAPEEAARRYKETVAAVQEETDRAERVALYRDLEFTLAGTRYAPAAARLRKNEQKLLERDAALVCREVAREIKKNPEDRESNLSALNEALEKVAGLPTYEERIRSLIDEQRNRPASAESD